MLKTLTQKAERKDSPISATQIIMGLWIGNEDSAITESWVRQNKISLIINCTKDVPTNIKGITYCRIPVDDLLKKEDTDKMTLFLPIVVETIHRYLSQGKNVLVHCHQGIQRSATVVTAYIMKYYNLQPREAINFVIKRRKEAFFGGKYVNFSDSLKAYRKLLDREIMIKKQRSRNGGGILQKIKKTFMQ